MASATAPGGVPPAAHGKPLWINHVNWLPVAALVVMIAILLLGNVAVFGVGWPLNDLAELAPESPLWLNTSTTFSEGPRNLVFALKDASARLSWMTLGIFQTVAFLLCIAYFCCVIRKTLPVPVRTQALVSLGIFIAFAGVVGLLFDMSDSNPDRVLSSGMAYSGKLHQVVYKKIGAYWLWGVVTFENFLALAVIILGTVAAGATVANPVSELFTADSLRRRMGQLRNLLTASAVVLVIGVLQISAEFRWPAAMVVQGVSPTTTDTKLSPLPIADTLSQYASAFTLAAGGGFTLFLFAVFGTSFWVLDQKAAALAGQQTGVSSLPPSAWRSHHGITLSWLELYADLTKVVGPLIVATLGSFIRF